MEFPTVDQGLFVWCFGGFLLFIQRSVLQPRQYRKRKRDIGFHLFHLHVWLVREMAQIKEEK